MSIKTTPRPGSALALPVYANKPQRRVPGVDGVVAVTNYSTGTGNGHIRQYSLFTEEGEYLGKFSAHSRRIAQSAGYHLGHGSYDPRTMDYFQNMPQVAQYLLDASKEI